MGSTRLPGKVLLEINKIPLLKFQIDRIENSKKVDKIVVATTVAREDDSIESFCVNNQIEFYRGSQNDVLSRYYECASNYQADVIVRLTADCPLSDPDLIDKVVSLFLKSKADYAANTIPVKTSNWPDGSDVEVFSFEALERAQRESTSAEEREHVTFFFWKNKENGFKTIQLDNEDDWSKYRFTIDYPEDLKVIQLLMDEIESRQVFGNIEEIIKIFKSKPEISKINEEYYFGIGWDK